MISIETDPRRFDLGMIHGFLTQSYWAKGIPFQVLRRAIDNSLCFAVFDGTRQVGFARVISDYATFAYLADVFVLEEHRGCGYAKEMMRAIVAHPKLQGLRRWMLATRDAHGLYAQYGFEPLSAPDRFMEIHRPEIYGKG